MTFKTGTSGNPRGRPKKERAWASLISAFGKKKVMLFNGEEVPAQQLIAQLTIDALITGTVTFPRLYGQPRRKPLTLEVSDWIRFLSQTREHLEGGATMEVDLSTLGEKLEQAVHIYLPDNARKNTK